MECIMNKHFLQKNLQIITDNILRILLIYLRTQFNNGNKEKGK